MTYSPLNTISYLVLLKLNIICSTANLIQAYATYLFIMAYQHDNFITKKYTADIQSLKSLNRLF